MVLQLPTMQGKPGGQAADEFNAFFYTLVSKDTQVRTGGNQSHMLLQRQCT